MSYSPYVYGTEAKKLDYEKVPKKRVVKKKKAVNKVSTKTVLIVMSLFVMLMVITYRYNLINEGNLKVQLLDEELNKVSSNLAGLQMNIEQTTNLTDIENYAKQKLGMQKPDKNQIVYIDSSKDTNIVKSENYNFFDSIVQNIKEMLK